MATQDDRVLTLMRAPGVGAKTARQVAEDIYGPGTKPSAISNILKAAVDAGHLTRTGQGHRMDPYRYEAVVRDSFDVMGRGQPYGP